MQVNGRLGFVFVLLSVFLVGCQANNVELPTSDKPDFAMQITDLQAEVIESNRNLKATASYIVTQLNPQATYDSRPTVYFQIGHDGERVTRTSERNISVNEKIQTSAVLLPEMYRDYCGENITLYAVVNPKPSQNERVSDRTLPDYTPIPEENIFEAEEGAAQAHSKTLRVDCKGGEDSSELADFDIRPKNPAPGQQVTMTATAAQLSPTSDRRLEGATWYVNGDRVAAGLPYAGHLFDEAGTYNVTLSVTSPEGETATNTETVIVNGSNLADFEVTNPYKNPQTLQFTALNIDDNPSSEIDRWQWRIDGEIEDTARTGAYYTKNFEETGRHKATLEVFTDDGEYEHTAYFEVETGFTGGDKGIELSFSDNAPPNAIADDGQLTFPVIVEARNEGQATVPAEDATITLEDFSYVAFNKTQEELSKQPPENISGSTMTPSAGVPLASPVFTEFPDFSYVEDVQAGYESAIVAKMCYEYESTTQSELCVHDDMLGRDNPNLCYVSGTRTRASTGAPVKITKVSQKRSTSDRTILNLTVRNVGGGDVFETGTTCEPDQSQRVEGNVQVTFSGLSGVSEIDCRGHQKVGDRTFRLRGISQSDLKKGETFSCDLTIPEDNRNNRVEQFNAKLDYLYQTRTSKTLTVRNTVQP